MNPVIKIGYQIIIIAERHRNVLPNSLILYPRIWRLRASKLETKHQATRDIINSLSAQFFIDLGSLLPYHVKKVPQKYCMT